ncbi:MAG: hypothetical protein Q4P23_11080 [Micrococcaceae bacterium]|nr:hypothetical protein [Micrococcaceae bacterium]
MQETDSRPRGGKARRRPLVPVAIGVFVVVLAAAGWAGYRVLDPVSSSHAANGLTCMSTAFAQSSPATLIMPRIILKPGQSIVVGSLTMVDPVNFELFGAGVQHRSTGAGYYNYPLDEELSSEARAWTQRVGLPAALGDGPAESVILVIVPVDLEKESSLNTVRVGYRNGWGIPYRTEVVGPFEARADCDTAPGEDD